MYWQVNAAVVIVVSAVVFGAAAVFGTATVLGAAAVFGTAAVFLPESGALRSGALVVAGRF